MTLPNLFQQLGWLMLLIPVLGLALSFTFRGKPWGVFFWMPTVLFLSYAALWPILRMSAYGQVRGPDAIGVGFAHVGLLLMLVPALLGLGVSFFARPRRDAWRWATTAPALLLCAGLVALVYAPQGALLAGNVSVVNLRLVDAKGRPLPGVVIRMVAHEDGLSVGGSKAVSGADGSFCFSLRQRQSVSLELHHPFPPSGQLSDMPTFWDAGFRLPEKEAGNLVINHSWQRTTGGVTLNEGFTESIPAKRQVGFTIILPPHAGLVVPALRDRIHRALLATANPDSNGRGYEYACRNVEAVEFIPWLIEAYHRNEQARSSLIEGLARTASTLAELDRGCRALQEVAANPRRHNQNYIEGEFAYESAQMIAWTGIGDATHPVEALAKARLEISDRAKAIWEFVLAERSRDGNVMKLFGELEQLAAPGLPGLLQSLRDLPPHTVREIQQWGPALWRSAPRKTRASMLQPLWASENALLVLLACEAMGNQLEADAGGMALGRLEAVRPAVKDRDTLQRIDMYIAMLHPKK